MLRFDVVCTGDLSQQEIVILAFLARVFTEKSSLLNLIFFGLQINKIVKKVQHDNVSSCIFLSEFSVRNLEISFFLALDPFTTQSGYHFHDIEIFNFDRSS